MFIEDYAPGEPAGIVAPSLPSRSLRFNSADSAYLARTPGVAGDRKTWSQSWRVKRAKLGTAQSLCGCGTTSSDTDYLSVIFNSSDQIAISGGTTSFRITSQVFRDTAAFYDILVVADTNNGTAADRIRLYVNGVRVTAFGTTNNPSSAADLGWGQAIANHIGRRGSGADYFDGYLYDYRWVDGLALDASYFGETDGTSGAWKPKIYSSSHGTQGCWLSFENNASTTTLGYDDAGGAVGAGAGSNDWALTNFSVSAGPDNDSLADTPTNNFCTFNKLSPTTTAALANGNLDAGASAIAIGGVGILSTARYWEITSAGGTTTVGLHNGSATSTTTVTAGNTKGFRFDAAAGTFDWTSDGTNWNSIATGLTSGPYFVYVSTASATTASLNCGQRAFAFTQPGGYNRLCTADFSTPAIVKPSAHMNAVLYTGNASARSVTGMGHQPDLLWFKNRGASASHILVDSARGSGWEVQIDTSDDANSARVSSLDPDGWTFVSNSAASLNANTNTYVAWSWKKGVTPGFDIVTYTGNGSNRTIAHALGVAPKFLMIKDRNGAASNNWFAWHANLTSGAYRVIPNTTAAQDNAPTMMNSTAPTSSVFSVGTAGSTNVNAKNYVAWLWAEVAGFSRFSSYTGNSSADGPFIWCGFRPRFVMIKRIDTTADWQIFDSVRAPANMISTTLAPNSTSAESSFAVGYNIDFLSNGFKPKVSSAAINNSAGTYIFAAFAEFPFKYANAR